MIYDGVSSAIKEKFWSSERHIARVSWVNGGTTYTATEDNIVQGGLAIDRYCATGNTLEYGSAVAAQMTLRLSNRNGAFSGTIGDGCEMSVEVGVASEPNQMIPMGYFIVDATPRNTSTISITALDRMVKFDRLIATSRFKDVTTLLGVLQVCCDVCGVPLSSNINTMFSTAVLNTALDAQYSYSFNETTTYRDVIRSVAMLLFGCAFIDNEGKLMIANFNHGSNAYVIVPDDRYEGADIYDDAFYIHSVTMGVYDPHTFADDVTIKNDANENRNFGKTKKQLTFTNTEGKNGHVLTMNNILVPMFGKGAFTSPYQNVPTAYKNYVLDQIDSTYYHPFTMSIKASPWMYPMDTLSIRNVSGTYVKSYITAYNFVLNGHTKISCVASGATTANSGGAGGTSAMSISAVYEKVAENKSAIDSILKGEWVKLTDFKPNVEVETSLGDSLRIRKTGDHTVMCGGLKVTTAMTYPMKLLTLPTEFRPRTNKYFIVAMKGGYSATPKVARIYVQPGGTLGISWIVSISSSPSKDTTSTGLWVELDIDWYDPGNATSSGDVDDGSTTDEEYIVSQTGATLTISAVPSGKVTQSGATLTIK